MKVRNLVVAIIRIISHLWRHTITLIFVFSSHLLKHFHRSERILCRQFFFFHVYLQKANETIDSG